MTNTKEKIEGYLMKLSLSFQEAGTNSWIVRDPEKGIENLLIMVVETHVIVRTDVMAVPTDGKTELLEELLKLNATEMVHGAYGIDGKKIVIIDTLDLDTMDLEELESAIDAVGLATAEHYKILSKYRAKK